MDHRVVDRLVHCPYCDAGFSIVVDLSAGGQTYIEDCQVCCQPMQISFDVSEDSLASLDVPQA